MRAMLASLALAGLLWSCGQANAPSEEASAPAYDMVAGAASDSGEASRGLATSPQLQYADLNAREAKDAPPPPPPAPDAAPQHAQPAGPAPVLFLAYTYQIGLELPAGRFDAVMQAQVKACQDAGPRVCQLIGSSRSGDPSSYMQGYVNLRAEPGWLRGFMTGVAHQAEEAGGKIKSQTTSTEDLTRAIVDTEAALRAKTTLRDRLQRLLATRPGKLSDLLDVERELARVQGEIDATQSELAVMRTRVSMSELTLNYESAAQPLRSDTFKPLGDAFANFLGLVVGGVAAIITVIAVALPWAVVIALVVWAVLAIRRRRGGRFFAPREAKAAETPASPPPA
jgi:Domain of unknown function (DUF4349)